MKYGYKEIRKIDSEDIRLLCIYKNWFTQGDCAEYEELLNYGGKPNITSDDIVEMATLILAHSNTEYQIESIMFELARICRSFFTEV